MCKVAWNDRGVWKWLSDTYEDFARAATIATALENRGHKVFILECVEA